MAHDIAKAFTDARRLKGITTPPSKDALIMAEVIAHAMGADYQHVLDLQNTVLNLAAKVKELERICRPMRRDEA